MLFNKEENGQEELKALLGFLYSSNNFDNIKTDIELAEEDIQKIIGPEIFSVAQNYYSEPGVLNPLLVSLVEHIQLPVALYAYFAFAAHTDISHSENGRKVTLDPESEKMPWEWMVRKDDEAILNKAHKTTDRLLTFLEKNVEGLRDWQDSDARKMARSCFINTASKFNEFFPIDNSRRFFMAIVPFMKEVEKKHILPVLGLTRYEDMKSSIESGEFEDPDNILSRVQLPIALYTLSIAIRRLSVSIMPNGIFQDYVSERLTQKAKQPASSSVRQEVAKSLQYDAEFELNSLQKLISELEATAAGEKYEPTDLNERMDPDQTFIRL